MDPQHLDRTITGLSSELPWPLSIDFIEISKRLGDLDMYRQAPLLQLRSITALNIVFQNIKAQLDRPYVSVSCLGGLDLVPPFWRRKVQCFSRNLKTGRYFLEVTVSDCHAFFEKNSLTHKSGVFLRIEFFPFKRKR